MKHILYLLLLIIPSLAFTACEDNADQVDNSEFTKDWQNRNSIYFIERMNEAKNAIEAAKKTHGDSWEEHCDWRIYRSFAKMPGGNITDSICVKIVERGKGSGCPLYTDSVKVNYIGRLMPTESYTNGRVFDHSGIYDNEDYVFNPNFYTPSVFDITILVEGLATALQHMHIGDRWKVYLPQDLAYKETSPSDKIPPYSTLIFDIQLKAYYRPGFVIE